MEITTVYQKERHEFGQPVNAFEPSPISLFEEFDQDKDLLTQHIERNPSELNMQARPEYSENYVNTFTPAYISLGMLHLEGGWPKDVDVTENDQKL